MGSWVPSEARNQCTCEEPGAISGRALNLSIELFCQPCPSKGSNPTSVGCPIFDTALQVHRFICAMGENPSPLIWVRQTSFRQTSFRSPGDQHRGRMPCDLTDAGASHRGRLSDAWPRMTRYGPSGRRSNGPLRAAEGGDEGARRARSLLEGV